MLRRRRDRRGFTLVEMLIVVAIIAILVAVSIPLVSTSLEKVRCATDAANERVAKAVASAAYLDGDIKGSDLANWESVTEGVYLYDAENGIYKPYAHPAPTCDAYGKCEKHRNKAIWFKVTADGVVHLTWLEKVSGTGGGLGSWDQDLCSKELGG